MSDVTPKAGEWYEWSGKRVQCVANHQFGGIVLQYDDGSFGVYEQWIHHELTHLPSCTGWDWEPPTESPDDWVTQDQVPARRGDLYRVVNGGWTPSEEIWRECVAGSYPLVYGYSHGKKINGGTLELRCRRRDLPKPEPAKRKVKVPMWLVAGYTVQPCGFMEVEVTDATSL